MYYLVTIGYETDQVDRSGNVRLQKVKYVVEAETVEEVAIICGKYRKEDTRGSDLLSIVKLPIECLITPMYNQNLYKK